MCVVFINQNELEVALTALYLCGRRSGGFGPWRGAAPRQEVGWEVGWWQVVGSRNLGAYCIVQWQIFYGNMPISLIEFYSSLEKCFLNLK